MKVTIKHHAAGMELAFGSVSQETWDYIQDKHKGNAKDYLAALIANDNCDYSGYNADDKIKVCLGHCNDDLFHKAAGHLVNGRIEITNNKGKTIYKCAWRNMAKFRQLGIHVDPAYKSIDWFVRYISMCAIPTVVTLTGEFDIEGEFDPTKLNVLCTIVVCDGTHTAAMVTGFEYNGKRIDCSIENTRSSQMDFRVIENSRLG